MCGWGVRQKLGSSMKSVKTDDFTAEKLLCFYTFG